MDATRNEDPRYQRAKKRVEEIEGFVGHLIAYVTISVGLFVLDFLTNQDDWWFYWPLVVWGVVVVIHAAILFGVEGRFGRRWEERKIRELMERDQLHQGT
jgi:hypothetical protein